jgi:ubiquinone/menaquinone biosynthesis C-methylase UbiE
VAEETDSKRGHRWFAALYDFVNRWSEKRVLRHLRPFVAGEAPGQILEIGAGTGTNLPYYRLAEKIVATEPDPFMLSRARKRAAQLGLSVELHQCPAEALPFPDGSFDTVVSTLVLCTVNDPARSLAEIRRVLKAGGTFRFMEHVRGGKYAGPIHDFLTPMFSWFGAGCRLNRKTVDSVEAAGFKLVEMRQRRLMFLPLVIGVAREKGRTPEERL